MPFKKYKKSGNAGVSDSIRIIVGGTFKMKRIYQAVDFYMLRTQVFPVDMLEEMGRNGGALDYDVYRKNPIFEESMTAATHNAFNMLYKQKDSLNASEKETLLKYAIRSSTRCTPYGIFSGVDLGTFEKHTDVIVDMEKNQTRTRVDMGWLCAVIKKLEEQNENVLKLSVIFNRQCIVKGERIFNPYLNELGSQEQRREGCEVSLRYTEILKRVKQVSEKWIPVKEIIELLKKDRPEVSENTIFKFLNNLIENEILLTELRPALLIGKDSALEHLISVLESRKIQGDLLVKLKKINTLTAEYDSEPLGNRTSVYHKICDLMKSIKESSDYLQIDMQINCEKNQLSYEIKEECERIADFFAHMSAAICDTEELNLYKMGFLEKYGYHRMIPLVELLDEDLGLGAPSSFAKTCRFRAGITEKNKKVHSMLKRILSEKIQSALFLGEKEINLDEDDFSALYEVFPIEDGNYTFPSIDLFVKIFAQNREEIEKGNYQLCVANTGMSYIAGNTWGRFADMFQTESICQDLKNGEEECLDETEILSSLSEMFSAGRLENITLNKNSYDYQIVMGTTEIEGKKLIPIDDIVIGVDSKTDRFFAYSLKLKKRIISNVNNMLNPTYGSAAFRFLRNMITAGKQNPAYFMQVLAELEYVYTPRIVFGKTIMRLATWKLDISAIEEIVNSDNWEKKFSQWCERWNVPDCVYYRRGDNGLVLNLQRREYKSLLKNLLKKSIKEMSEVYLNEVLDERGKCWIQNIKKERFTNEFVLSLYPVQKQKKRGTGVETFCEAEDGKTRILLPGMEQWIYLKIYVNRYRVEEFIADDMFFFCQALSDQGMLEKYFFIRYKDEAPHIRLRLKCSTYDGIGELFQTVSDWLLTLKERGIIYKVQIDTYEREMERYGGKAVIAAAEDFFFEDSQYLCKIMQMIRGKQSSYKEEFIAVITIISMMRMFGMSISEQEKWLSGSIDRKIYRKEYLTDKKMVYDAIYYYEAMDQRNMEELKLDQYISKHELALKRYIEEVRKNGTAQIIYNKDLLDSLIHMFCNRFKGDNVWERKIRAFTRHGLYSVIQERKNYKDK